MEEKKIRHIPVIDDNQHLVGIVTVSDIREAAPSIFRANEHMEDLQKPIESIMKKDVITGHPLDFVEEIAAYFMNIKSVVSQLQMIRNLSELSLKLTF